MKFLPVTVDFLVFVQLFDDKREFTLASLLQSVLFVWSLILNARRIQNKSTLLGMLYNHYSK